MAEFPILPLFTDAYLADTRHLSAAQHGAYLMLIMTAWRSPDCSIPNDDRLLAKYACMDFRTWNKNKGTILSFWRLTECKLKFVQARLLDERKYVEHKRSKNVDAGRVSALKRKERGSTNVITKPQHKLNQPTPTLTLTEEKDNTNVLSKKKISIEDLTISHIERWLSEKRTIGKYLTIDEHGQLEYFKDYCRSKNKKYSDYLAAFRNSFNWENAIKKGNGKNGKYTNDDALREAIAERRANHASGAPVLCNPVYLRKDTGAIENPHAGNGAGFTELLSG